RSKYQRSLACVDALGAPYGAGGSRYHRSHTEETAARVLACVFVSAYQRSFMADAGSAARCQVGALGASRYHWSLTGAADAAGAHTAAEVVGPADDGRRSKRVPASPNTGDLRPEDANGWSDGGHRPRRCG